MNQNEIKSRRLALGLTITKLATYLGASQQYVSQLENETRNASDAKLKDIDAVLVKLEDIAKISAALIQPKKRKNN